MVYNWKGKVVWGQELVFGKVHACNFSFYICACVESCTVVVALWLWLHWFGLLSLFLTAVSHRDFMIHFFRSCSLFTLAAPCQVTIIGICILSAIFVLEYHIDFGSHEACFDLL